jgi:hypothetical protein
MYFLDEYSIEFQEFIQEDLIRANLLMHTLNFWDPKFKGICMNFWVDPILMHLMIPPTEFVYDRWTGKDLLIIDGQGKISYDS